MKIIEVVATAENFFKDVLQKPGVVVGVSREDESWKVQIEVAEEVEYMRKRARDDLLALYEVFIDDNLEITAFERKSMRERNSISLNTD